MGPNFGQMGQYFLDFFGHCGQIFHFFHVFLAPVNSLKCVGSKNTLNFYFTPILRALNWLRKQNGTKL